MQQVMGRWPYLQASVLRRRARWARGMPQRGRSAEGDMCSRRRWRAPSVHAQRHGQNTQLKRHGGVRKTCPNTTRSATRGPPRMDVLSRRVGAGLCGWMSDPPAGEANGLWDVLCARTSSDSVPRRPPSSVLRRPARRRLCLDASRAACAGVQSLPATRSVMLRWRHLMRETTPRVRFTSWLWLRTCSPTDLLEFCGRQQETTNASWQGPSRNQQTGMDPVSWATAAHLAGVEHYVAQIRGRSVKPRAIRSMVRCMTEALRIRKCKWLESAMWIFLGFDDKNGLKLLRFKRDASAEAESSSHTCFDAVNAESSSQTRIDSVRAAGDPFWLQYGAQIGVVGCMPVGLEYDMDDYDRDYAERTCEEIVNLIKRLCTPQTLDAQWFESVLAKVAGIVVDGALLKTSCRDPLHDADVFSEQYSRLFDQRHAVLKDFMNSGTWQDQLQKCQEELLQSGAPGLTSVLRHLAFVQPRFESCVSPRRRYVCLLRAIAMVLARKAGDERLDSAVQRRAEAALTAMSWQDLPAIMAKCVWSFCGSSTSRTIRAGLRVVLRARSARGGDPEDLEPDSPRSNLGRRPAYLPAVVLNILLLLDNTTTKTTDSRRIRSRRQHSTAGNININSNRSHRPAAGARQHHRLLRVTMITMTTIAASAATISKII